MGVDPSLRGFAVAVAPLSWGGDWRALSFGKFGTSLKKGATVHQRIDRAIEIADQVEAFVELTKVTHAFFEGYAFSKRDMAHSLGEVGGIVRARLRKSGVVLVDAPIGSVRKTLVGRIPRGFDPKQFVREALEAGGMPVEYANDADIADAVAVLNFGMIEFGGFGFLAEAS